jgi:hypothetical protein
VFDTLEWNFINHVMECIGIPVRLRTLMSCLMGGKVTVLINGTWSEIFRLSKGLRQGRPMLLYLFIIAMEFLTKALVKTHDTRRIKGVQVAMGARPYLIQYMSMTLSFLE